MFSLSNNYFPKTNINVRFLANLVTKGKKWKRFLPPREGMTVDSTVISAHLQIPVREDLLLHKGSHVGPTSLQVTLTYQFTRKIFPSHHICRFTQHCSCILEKTF